MSRLRGVLCVFEYRNVPSIQRQPTHLLSSLTMVHRQPQTLRECTGTGLILMYPHRFELLGDNCEWEEEECRMSAVVRDQGAPAKHSLDSGGRCEPKPARYVEI